MNNLKPRTPGDAATAMITVAAFIRTHDLPAPTILTFYSTTRIQVREKDWPAWATALSPDNTNTVDVGIWDLHRITTMQATIHGNPINLVTVTRANIAVSA